MDALSHVLQSAQLKTALYGTVWLEPPWGIHLPRGESAMFHAFLAGGGWLRLEGARDAIAVAQGDVLVLPHGDAHTFFDDPRSPVRALDAVSLPSARARRRPNDAAGAHPRGSRVVCGHLWFEHGAATPLVRMLPAVVHMRAGGDAASWAWIEPLLALLAREGEAPGAGTDALLARLGDLVVIQAVRAHLAQMPLEARRWAGALADERLAAALRLVHERPEAPWTVASLASAVGVSRAALARRFVELVGEPPLAYVTRCRMQRARTLLGATDAGLAEIAARVGYETEAAFHRAFKRHEGVTPGEVRRRARAPRERGRALP